MFNKIFNPENLSSKGISTELLEATCLYHLSVLWTRDGSGLSLLSLNGKLSNSTNWHVLAPTVVTDYDGEITMQVGHFAKGTSIDLTISLYALADIGACAVFLVNVTDRTHKQLFPNSGTKALKKGEKPWNNAKTIQLG